MSYTDLVPTPPANSINTGHTPCPTHFLLQKFGSPRLHLTDDCQPVTAPFWHSRMVTEDVGPFRVTGHRLAVALLRQTFDKVRSADPPLYAALGTAGMLCCRQVRGSHILSNHGLGLAVDITLNGHLDQRGDGMTQKGLLELYGYMKQFGWWWGAEFGTEDSMHFECSAEVVMAWVRGGIF